MSSLSHLLRPFSSFNLATSQPDACGFIVSDLAKLDLAREALFENRLLQCKELVEQLHSEPARNRLASESSPFFGMLVARIHLEQLLHVLVSYGDQCAFQGYSELSQKV